MAGIAKTYNLTFDYVLHKMSIANVRMYSAVIPPPPKIDKREDKGQKPSDTDGVPTLDGDDPNNREAVNKAIFDLE